MKQSIQTSQPEIMLDDEPQIDSGSLPRKSRFDSDQEVSSSKTLELDPSLARRRSNQRRSTDSSKSTSGDSSATKLAPVAFVQKENLSSVPKNADEYNSPKSSKKDQSFPEEIGRDESSNDKKSNRITVNLAYQKKDEPAMVLDPLKQHSSSRSMIQFFFDEYRYIII